MASKGNRLIYSSFCAILLSLLSFTAVSYADDDCEGVFSHRTDHIVNSKPISIFAGDLDNDGYQDIAMACYFREYMSYIFNNGDATFTWPTWALVPYYTEWVDGADFNGDGFIDIVTANSGDPNVSVLINDGQRSFELRHDNATYGNCRSVRADNFNSDNYPDIVAANYWTSKISVLINRGDGTFENYTSYDLPGNPRGIYSADLDNDGDNDVITANLDQNTITIFENDGEGVFTISSNRPVGDQPFMVFAANLNNDNYIDLITPNSGDSTISILFNNGNSTFMPPIQYIVGQEPVYVRAVDIDEDGDNDLITANSDDNSITTLINEGNGVFGHATENATNINPHGIAAADFDGDTHPDLAIATFMTNYISVLKNANALPFTGSLLADVRDHAHEPIGDVTIELLGESTFGNTSGDGYALMNDICCTLYDIQFSHEDFCDTVLTGVRISPDDTTIIDLTMNFRGIAGTIEDDESVPIESVLVDIPGLGLNAYSDSLGQYHFGCVGTTANDLVFYHPHFVDTSVSSVSATLNDTTVVDMTMMPRGFITGVIRDTLMQPIEGIEVAIDGIAYDTSGVDGSYRMEYLNTASYDISFRSAYYYDTSATAVTVTPGDTTYVDLIMSKRPDLEIWYGSLSCGPVEVMLGEEVAIDVYIRTAGPIQIEDARLILGADNDYIDEFLSAGEGEIFYPFDIMDEAEFSTPLSSPPNPAGWSSQYLEVSAEMAQSPWFDFSAPTIAARFVVTMSADTSLVGDTVVCIGAGLDESGDTSRVEGFSTIGFDIKQHFCQFSFIGGYHYFPGDVNMYTGSWPPDVIGSDVTYLVNYFRGLQPGCLLDGFYASADVNGDCQVFGADVTVLVNYFRGSGVITFCPDYQTQWPTRDDFPQLPPVTWPGCE